MSVMMDPLVAPPPTEVPLANAPLVRVIAQVRFPEVLAIEQRHFVAPFQEAVRTAYPVLRQEQTQGILLSPAGAQPARLQIAWRFGDIDGDWRVSLTPGFLALETTKYTSRSDFLERLGTILNALDENVQPKLIDRLGVRYIARITGSAVDEIADLVSPEVRGIVGTVAATHVVHAISESLFELPGARVLTRWGRLPPGATIDAAAIEPASEKSWILDLDMFSTGPIPFEVDRIVTEAKGFSERLYTIFRWVVTDEFLRRFGGTP